MKKATFLFPIVLIIFLFSTKNAEAHCEVPCGIYNDSIRIVLMKEHISTLKKSMHEINDHNLNVNQQVRWVMNKEEHANKLQEIATQYFMFQRIKVSSNDAIQARNMKLLQYLHEICVYAMKAKQTTDEVWIEKLQSSVEAFEELYFKK